MCVELGGKLALVVRLHKLEEYGERSVMLLYYLEPVPEFTPLLLKDAREK